MPDGPDAPAPTRGHKKRERTRRQLVAAAVEVISEQGEAFTVSEVADRAGVANGTFYNYFDDRDALIAAIVPEVVGAFASEHAIAVAEVDPAARFAAITAVALTHAMTQPDQLRVVLRLEAAQREVLRGAPVRHLRDDLMTGWSSGRFVVEPSDAVLDVLVGSILTASRRIVDRTADDRYPSEVIATLLRALGIGDPEAGAIAARAMTDAHQRALR